MIEIPDSWITPKARFSKSQLGGKGMFANSPIKKGDKVVVWGGTWNKDYVNKEGSRLAKKQGKMIMQWDTNLYSVENRGDDPTYFINHSCDPNVWITDAFTLVAIRNIKKGEEILADYALWEADENYVSRWDCLCGFEECRNRVTGIDWKKKNLQKKYKDHFSPLINKRIKNL